MPPGRRRASPPRRHLDAAPEIPGGHGPVGPPALAQHLELNASRQRGQAVELLCALPDAVVSHRKYIEAAQREHQEHVRGPLADALDAGYSLDHLGISHPAQSAIREGPVGKGRGDSPKRRRLLPREAEGAQLGLARRK